MEADEKISQIRERLQRATSVRKKIPLVDVREATHASMRMSEGLRKVLQLHTPSELSSICGSLSLKSLQKASNSIDQILTFALNEKKLFAEDKVARILQSMWEGPLWEYLRCIGHPVSTEAQDPRKTILTIWQSGGMLVAKGAAFTPHFIVREVKPRYQWIQSEDITNMMEKLNIQQEKAKRAERLIIVEQDYSNILIYFKETSELRKLENQVREYLASELEICRSKVDIQDETVSICREQLADCEQQVIQLSEELNDRLARSEVLHEDSIAARFKLEGEMQRLQGVIEAHIEAAKNRHKKGGGSMQPMSLHNVANCNISIQKIHEKLQDYMRLRDNQDDEQRANARRLLVDKLAAEQGMRWASVHVEIANTDAAVERARANAAKNEVRYCADKMMRMSIRQQVCAEQAWGRAVHWANKAIDLEQKINATLPVLLAGIQHSEKSVSSLSCALVDTLGLGDLVVVKETKESAFMEVEDVLSAALRAKQKADDEEAAALLAAQLAAAAEAEAKKKSKGRGGGRGLIRTASSRQGIGNSDNVNGRNGTPLGGGKSGKPGTAGSAVRNTSRAGTPSVNSSPSKRPGTSTKNKATESRADSRSKANSANPTTRATSSGRGASAEGKRSVSPPGPTGTDGKTTKETTKPQSQRNNSPSLATRKLGGGNTMESRKK